MLDGVHADEKYTPYSTERDGMILSSSLLVTHNRKDQLQDVQVRDLSSTHSHRHLVYRLSWSHNIFWSV